MESLPLGILPFTFEVKIFLIFSPIGVLNRLILGLLMSLALTNGAIRCQCARKRTTSRDDWQGKKMLCM